MRKLYWVSVSMLCCAALWAETIEEKVDRLEKRLDTLEQKLKPVLDQEMQRQQVLKLRNQARIRARQDLTYYKPEELEQIENLYQSWSTQKGDDQKAVALTLQQKFPKANRTGCVMLYLAQSSFGEPQIELLKQVIRDYSDCYYFDGVQVGPYARLILGSLLEKGGHHTEAAACFDELKKLYPDAIGHNGKLLSADLSK